MKTNYAAALLAVAVVMAGSRLQADEVTVKGAHLCCGACVKAVSAALADVEGVSDAQCDRDASTITFSVANAKAAKSGVKALADAGFAGRAQMAGERVKFPGPKIKKGTKADDVTFTGVHLCCGGCVKGAEAAVESVEGVSEVKVDQDAGTIELVGKEIDVRSSFRALRKAGFYAKVKK